MGNRAHILVKDDASDLYVGLYTHWGGEELPKTLQMALRRGGDRINDSCYLSRIIFSEMIKYHVMEETGYGIFPATIEDIDIPKGPGDRFIVVEGIENKIKIYDCCINHQPVEFTISDFRSLENPTWEKLHINAKYI